MEALPARREEDSSGLEAGSAKEPAASLPWTEVDGHEEPPLTLSPAHLPGLGKRAWGCCPEGGHLGTARGTKEGIHNCFESPRALGPLKSPLEVDDFKGTGRDKSLINTASQAKASKGPGRSWQLASALRQSALWSGDHGVGASAHVCACTQVQGARMHSQECILEYVHVQVLICEPMYICTHVGTTLGNKDTLRHLTNARWFLSRHE